MIDQVLNYWIIPPGNFAYHLVIIFATVVVLMASFAHWRSSQNPSAGRAFVGLLLLLASRLILTVLAGVILSGLLSAETLLLPVDRAMNVIALLLIIWVWAFPDFTRIGDIATVLALMLTATVMVLSLVIWAGQPPGTAFNEHWLSLAWEIYAVVLLGFGSLLLLVRRPSFWAMGLAMLLMLMGGHLAEIFLADPAASYPVMVRWAQLIAFPLLFLLTQRMIVPATPLEMPKEVKIPTVAAPPERKPLDAGLFADLARIVSEREAKALYAALVRAVARGLQADVCLLVLPPTPSGEMVVCAGYNQVRKEDLPAFSLQAKDVPRLASAIRQGQSIRLLLQNTSVDLLNLSSVLNTSRNGNLVAAPLALPGLIAGVVLYSPYSEYAWQDEDEKALVRVTQALSEITQGTKQQDSANEMVDQLRIELNAALTEMDFVLKEKENLARQVASLRAAEKPVFDAEAKAKLEADYEEAKQKAIALQAENDALVQNLAGVESEKDRLASQKEESLTLVERLQAEIDDLRALAMVVPSQNGQEKLAQLEEENERLRSELNRTEAQLHAAIDVSPVTESQLEVEMRGLLKENARLQKVMGEQEVKLFQLERQIQAARGSDKWDTIVSISQELRQPMSSVVGYSDFLLSESVGILGALQRKFLERVKVSTERMIAMIEEMIQIASVEAGHTKLSVGSVDLMRAIDSAISEVSPNLREKNISLRMNLPDELPKIQGDYEAVQLIVTNLLQNAGLVSPEEGEISIGLEFESYSDREEYVLVKITDSGGGISSDDLQRVFGEHAERATGKSGSAIRGLGGSTLSLAFTKSLVEAHGGRIWVETEMDKGATFSVLLPLSREVTPSVLANWRT